MHSCAPPASVVGYLARAHTPLASDALCTHKDRMLLLHD